jgi:selenium metabolism protein YedF
MEKANGQSVFSPMGLPMPAKTVDALGLLCPQPLILVKRALKEMRVGEELTVLIDNPTSRKNVEDFLRDNHAACASTEANGVFTLKVIKREAALARPDAESYCAPVQGKPHAICINSNSMGRGNEELGSILIKALINTIKDTAPLPGAMVFYNSGILLALRDSPVIDSLRALEKAGVKLLICGTCLDYFKKKEELGAGRVSNMYDILQTLSDAGHVVYP